MPNDASLRKQLRALLREPQAHATLTQAIEGFPVEKAGIRPPGFPHSAWELLEHLRIAQHDIVMFSKSADHKSPKWPEGYWPPKPAPDRPEQWQEVAQALERDLATFEEMLMDPNEDLHKPFPWGDGQTLLREALLIADHNAYHVGQLVLVRRALGSWAG